MRHRKNIVPSYTELGVPITETRRARKGRGERGLGAATMRLITLAQPIVAQRKPITVRGVAYPFMLAQHIPSMEKREVDKVGSALVKAREHGLIQWEDIVDESRRIETVAAWDDLDEFAGTIERGYRKDYWSNQPYRLEVWSEKATVGGLIRPVTDALGVPFMALHGYVSATVAHNLATASQRDQRHFVILYVGDFDPSGMHMSEVDLPGRVARYGGVVEVRRIALLPEDVDTLPSFPAKTGDKRFPWYHARYGEKAWELDAMDPRSLRARVEAAIREYIDNDAWERMQIVEAAEQRTVARVAAAMRG